MKESCKVIKIENEYGAERFANAIVMQAVKDYRYNYARYKKHTCDAKAKDELERLERFFKSKWFAQLTDIDGEWILKEIRKRL